MRTTRAGRSLAMGHMNRPADDTLDRWTDLEVYATTDDKVLFRFRRFTDDGKLLDEYECVFDDETVLIDLAAQSLHGVIAIQANEDQRTAIDALTDEPTALDDDEEIERKRVRRETAFHRKVVTGNVKSKSRT